MFVYTRTHPKSNKVQSTDHVCQKKSYLSLSSHILNEKTTKSMQSSYKQLYIHLVFAVKGRANCIPPQHFEELQQCLTGIIQKQHGSKLIYAKVQADHTHLFIGWECQQTLSELVSKTKTTATGFIKRKAWGLSNFAWQKGYGAFAYSNHHIDNFVNYLKKQDTYHQTYSFKEEYLTLLEKFEISYENRHLFEFYDEVDLANTSNLTDLSITIRPNTYTKLLFHLVFVVKGRENLISKTHKEVIHQLLREIIEREGHHPIEIHCMPDHTHILLEFSAAKKLEQLVEILQMESQTFIRAQPWMPYAFEWQQSFGVFSCSFSHAKVVTKYIQNQEEHHRIETFQEEYNILLKEVGL